MVLSLPVVRVRMYGLLLRDVVTVGCCYRASLEVLHGEENQVSWDAALMLPVFLWGEMLLRSCGISWAVLGLSPCLRVTGCYLGSCALRCCPV